MKLTVRDAAALLSASEETVHRWIREGSIPVHRVNNQSRFHKAELLEWATARGIRVAPEQFEGAERGEPTPSFAEALEAGGVHYDVPGSDRASVLEAVVARMPIEEEDQATIVDFLAAREALGSTGVGEGIAIPHVRNPVVLHVARPSITLCFLAKPIDFDAIDGKPVDTIFSLVSSTIRAHLFLLSRIAASLHDSEFKKAVLGRAPQGEILAHARRLEAALAPPPGASAR